MSGSEEITIPPTCCERWRGKPGELLREIDELLPAARLRAVGELRGARELLGELREPVVRAGALGQAVELGGGQAERLADVADRAAHAVGGEDRDQRGVVAPPALVDTLDQLGADVAREVEVDVGQRVQLLVEEAPDEEVVVDRVDVREPDQVADHRGDRGAAAAPRREVGDASRGAGPAHVAGYLLRQLEDLEVDQEEPGEVVQLDEPQLLDELFFRFGLLCR